MLMDAIFLLQPAGLRSEPRLDLQDSTQPVASVPPSCSSMIPNRNFFPEEAEKRSRTVDGAAAAAGKPHTRVCLNRQFYWRGGWSTC